MTLQELCNDIGRVLKERPELASIYVVNEDLESLAGLELELPDELESELDIDMTISFWVEGKEASRWYERL